MSKIKLALLISAALFVSIISISYFASTDEDQTRRIVVFKLRYNYETRSDEAVASYVRVNDLKTHSFEWFLDPFGKTMTDFHNKNLNATSSAKEVAALFANADAFERYQLIRLPLWLGGYKQDMSAYRAYSALDISITSHCMIRYASEPQRLRIEDPCSGDIYRTWDGLVIHGPAVGGITTSNNALPMLRLALDDEGYVIAHKLDNKIDGDGVAGEGRKISVGNIERNNQAMIDAVSEYLAYRIPIPSKFDERDLNGIFMVDTSFSPELGRSEDVIVEATYGRHEPEHVDYTIRVLPLDEFPELGIDNASKDVDAFAETVFVKLNVFYGSTCECVTQSGSNLIGRYYMLKMPEETEREISYDAALIWTKSSDGKKDVLISIDGDFDVNKLREFAKIPT